MWKVQKQKDFVIGIFLFYLLALVLFGLLLVDVNPDDREAGDVEVVAVGVSDVSACHEIWGGLLLLPSLQQVPPPGVIFKSKNVWKKGNWIALQTGFDMLPGNSFPPHFRRSTNAINFFEGRKVLEHRSVAPAFMPVSAVYLVVHRSTNKSCVRSEF